MNPIARRAFKVRSLPLFTVTLLLFASQSVMAQRTLTLFGDVKIDETGAEGPPVRVMVVLYKDVGGEVGRQPISNRSRYRFANLQPGDYVLAIEVDDNEIARMRVLIDGLSSSPYGYQHDLEFALKPKNPVAKPSILSTEDFYNRPSPNKLLFQKAQSAVDSKHYDQATSFLKQIVENDKLDFQAWALLGAVYLVQQKPADAESAYLNAVRAKPTFAFALIALGKLYVSENKFDQAIDPLTRAIAIHPKSGDANYFLGEAYIHLKQGSKAVPYLNEAANNGRPDAHLRLGWLYNAAGIKDKAAAEYDEFLKKQPNYPDRKKLEEYISANRATK